LWLGVSFGTLKMFAVYMKHIKRKMFSNVAFFIDLRFVHDSWFPRGGGVEWTKAEDFCPLECDAV